MSHEKGIEAAIKAYEDAYEAPGEFTEADGVNVIIKAYLDASGMVMVPASPTEEMVTAWKVAFHEAYDGGKGVGTYDENIRFGLEASLINAPNTFQTPEESREKK